MIGCQPAIIRENERIGGFSFGTVRAAFREAPNACALSVFIIEIETPSRTTTARNYWRCSCEQQDTRIVVGHKYRLTRSGFHYRGTLLEIQGRTIEVVNVAENHEEDLIADLVTIVYSFTSRL